MQDAYESLVRTKSGDDVNVASLKANCLYVRFLPKDSTDIAILIKRILVEGILTRKQIYDCLTKEKYPSKSSEINEAF